MNFAKTKERIVSKSFDYIYNDEAGNEQTEKITFSFYEKCLTASFFDSVARFQQTNNSKDIANQLSKNITSWDLDWNGAPFPPSYENLANVCDVNFLMELCAEMMDSVQGDKKKPVTSPNTSADSARLETSEAEN
jgi:hypothetical protein